MRIGELSKRSLVPVRMLRYYEERGLLTPERGPNGYREYDESDVTRAALISSLVRSGLPTKLIIPLLRDCSDTTSPSSVDENLEDLFAAELERLDRRIACLDLSRSAIRKHLGRLRTPVPA